jgi:oligopeptide/dipeptide ABC transporter ATP-binding protein
MTEPATTTAPGGPSTAGPILQARGVKVRYHEPSALSRWISPHRSRRRVLHALDGVDLDVLSGETLALVGESGSGKSTLAKVLVGSIPATEGRVIFRGRELPPRRNSSMHRKVQMVFQDPYSSLNPRMTAERMLTELVPERGEAARQAVLTLLGTVGLGEDTVTAYPSQLSGGQRQRLAIARALAVRPDVLIADEAVSSLDVSVQATILQLLADLQRDLGLSLLFIAHNLAVVQHLCQRVAVMYLGRIVEVGDAQEIFGNPRHPSTQALIDAIPRMSARRANASPALPGEPPSPINLPTGCRFHPRCRFAQDICATTDPPLAPVPGAEASDRVSACHFSSTFPPLARSTT